MKPLFKGKLQAKVLINDHHYGYFCIPFNGAMYENRLDSYESEMKQLRGGIPNDLDHSLFQQLYNDGITI